MKIFFIGALLLSSIIPCAAQSIAGSWLKTNEVLLHQDGQTFQAFSKLTKVAPCLKTVVYTFSKDGKLTEDASHCKPEYQKIATSSLLGAGWSMSGDKVILTIADKTLPYSRMIFHVRRDGNDKMVWTFIYAENPGIPAVNKAKEIITTYERVN